MNYTQEQLPEILAKHNLWLNDEDGGVRADLHCANLIQANLSVADLSVADLSGADLSGADLRAANLRGAGLRGADLSGAKGIKQFGPMPTSGRMVYFVWHNTHWMVQAGCFWGTIDELESEVKKKHNCPFYLGIIELMRNHKP